MHFNFKAMIEAINSWLVLQPKYQLMKLLTGDMTDLLKNTIQIRKQNINLR